MKRSVTKYTGVYQRDGDKRSFNGKPDICFDITYKKDGQKIWEKVGWSSEGYNAKLAYQVRSERLRNIRHGQELPQQKKKVPHFKELAARYLIWAKENKANGARSDISRYNKYLSPLFDHKRLDQITSFDLERFKASLSKQGLSPASVKHCLVIIRQMFNKADQWGMYNGPNPIKGVKLPAIQNQRERFLSHEEADLLLSELRRTSTLIHDMALISLHCGLRAGEIFNLKGQDLDFINGLIHISDPKNKESRKAFMTKAVKEVLAVRKPKQPNEYVFKDRVHGGKVNSISQTFRRVVDSLEINAGITDSRQRVTFHSLRHTFASWLALQGETILTIKELLGHKTLAMTTRYAHLIPDHKRRAALNLEKIFNEKRNGSISSDTEEKSNEG